MDNREIEFEGIALIVEGEIIHKVDRATDEITSTFMDFESIWCNGVDIFKLICKEKLLELEQICIELEGKS